MHDEAVTDLDDEILQLTGEVVSCLMYNICFVGWFK